MNITVIVERQDLNKIEIIDRNFILIDELDNLIAVKFKVNEINNRRYTINLLEQMIPSIRFYTNSK